MRNVKSLNNLKPFNQLTKDEQRKIAKAGGKKSGEVRAERKLLKDELVYLLGLEVKGQTMQEKICLALINRAIEGDIRAFEVIRDSIGQKNVEISHEFSLQEFNPSEELIGEVLEKIRAL